MLLELTGAFWQIGVVACVAFTIAGSFALNWAYAQNHALNQPSYLMMLVDSYGWIFYALPIILLLLAWAFGIHAYLEYRKQRHIWN